MIEKTINISFGGKELCLRHQSDVREMDLLKIKGRLKINITHLSNSVLRNISDEKKLIIYNMIHLLNDSYNIIDNLSKLDEKRMINNFEYISKIEVMKKEIDKLNSEIENLKSNIPC